MKRAFLVAALLIPVAAFAGAKVSAFQKETKKGANFYNGGSAIDGKMETAWMVPGESPNRGEWIELDVPAGGTVDKLQVVIGYQKDDDSFKDYARLKQARVDMFTMGEDQNLTQVGTATVTFEDKPGVQVVDLPDTKVGGDLFGGKVKISVMDIFAGTDFPNLAVSEMAVVLKPYDVMPKFGEVSGESAGHPKDGVLDEDPKTFWAFPAAGAKFELDGTAAGVSAVGFVGQKDYAHPKTVRVTINGLTQTTVLADKPEVQWAATLPFNGYTGGAFGTVEVEIVDVYPGKNADIGLSALKVNATNNVSF